MQVELPAAMYKAPDSWPTKDRETNVPDGGTMFAHAVIIEGEPVKLYSNEDRTALNGSAAKLGTGEAVPVTVQLDLTPRNGAIKPRLIAIVERTGR